MMNSQYQSHIITDFVTRLRDSNTLSFPHWEELDTRKTFKYLKRTHFSGGDMNRGIQRKLLNPKDNPIVNVQGISVQTPPKTNPF